MQVVLVHIQLSGLWLHVHIACVPLYGSRRHQFTSYWKHDPPYVWGWIMPQCSPDKEMRKNVQWSIWKRREIKWPVKAGTLWILAKDVLHGWWNTELVAARLNWNRPSSDGVSIGSESLTYVESESASRSYKEEVSCNVVNLKCLEA